MYLGGTDFTLILMKLADLGRPSAGRYVEHTLSLLEYI